MICRFLDPLLGVFTGVLAFQLRQNDVRYTPSEEERLPSLFRWKYNQWREQRAMQSENDVDEAWTAALKSATEPKSVGCSSELLTKDSAYPPGIVIPGRASLIESKHLRYF